MAAVTVREAELSTSDASLSTAERATLSKLDVNHDGRVSASEVASFVAKKRADRAWLVGALSVLVALLAISCVRRARARGERRQPRPLTAPRPPTPPPPSYVAVGGIVFYVIRLTKDTKAVGTELTNTDGDTLHVMSTTATSVTTGLTSLLADGAFAGLQSVTAVTANDGSLTLGLSGFARSGVNVIFFTTSAAVPTLILSPTTLTLGPDASATAVAALGGGAATGGSGRLLNYVDNSCKQGAGKCASYVSSKLAPNGLNLLCPAGAFFKPYDCNALGNCATSNNGFVGRCRTCPTGQYTNDVKCTGSTLGTMGDKTPCHTVGGCTAIPAGSYAVSVIFSGTDNLWSNTVTITSASELTGKYSGAGVQNIAPCPVNFYCPGATTSSTGDVTVLDTVFKVACPSTKPFSSAGAKSASECRATA